MHYLVTGGAGFIGSHLVDSLVADGHKVTVLDDLSTGKKGNLQESELIDLQIGDCGDERLLSNIIPHVDGVYHLAAVASVQLSREDWQGTHKINLSTTIAILDHIAKDGRQIPFVYASSAAAFGDPDASLLPLREDAPLAPLTPYGADKAGCELHARAASAMHYIPTLGFRFFNVYGPRQDPSSPYSGVISIFADRLSKGLPITFFGDGHQTRDFIYISDIVSRITIGMQQLHAGTSLPLVLHGCTGIATSVRKLANTLASLLEIQPEIHEAPAREGDIVHSYGDPAPCRQHLDIPSDTPLREGLEQLIQSQEQDA